MLHGNVNDPRHPLGALTDLVERPQDLEELLALRALTDRYGAVPPSWREPVFPWNVRRAVHGRCSVRERARIRVPRNAHAAGDAYDGANHDPERYGPAQALGNALRGAGHKGVCYDSVRAPGGTCFGTFRPVAVADVGDAATELELVWDGSKIAEYREITTHCFKRVAGLEPRRGRPLQVVGALSAMNDRSSYVLVCHRVIKVNFTAGFDA